jgi:Tol biopolymer transport system component
MQADGSSQHTVADNPALDTLPVWSPDSRQLAFAALEPNGGPKIYLVNVDGSNLRMLIKWIQG